MTAKKPNQPHNQKSSSKALDGWQKSKPNEDADQVIDRLRREHREYTRLCEDLRDGSIPLAAEITVFKSRKGHLSKHFDLKSLKKPKRGVLSDGDAICVPIMDLESLRDLKLALTSRYALCYGVTDAEEIRIVSEEKLRGEYAYRYKGAIPRNCRHFRFRKGEPGVFVLDVDFEPEIGMPVLTPDQFDRLLCRTTPWAEEADRLYRYSCSQGIHGHQGEALRPLQNFKVYFIIEDASAIPALLKALRRAFMEAGHVWTETSPDGKKKSKKTFIDPASGTPVALDYAGPASLGKGLTQNRPVPILKTGTKGQVLEVPLAFIEQWTPKRKERSPGDGTAPASILEVADALRFISADDRDTWLKAGMALHHDFGEDGRGLWDEWSLGGNEDGKPFPRYDEQDKFDPEDQERVWASFDDDCDNPVTVGSIFHMARENDWHSYRPKAKDEFEALKPDPVAEQAERLAREQAAKQEASALASTPAVTPAPIPFKWTDPAQLPKRRWIYNGHYLRRFATGTFAPGAAGKTSQVTAEALAIVTGKPLLGIQPNERCNVWIFNGEDPREELQRRVTAAMLAHNVAPEEVEGRLFLNSGRDTQLVLATQTRQGAMVQAPVENAIIQHLKENNIGVMIVDPFVSSHGVNENDNSAIDMVAKAWNRVADKADCSIELVHHTRKLNGNEEPSIDDGRGASALANALRSCRILVRMNKAEAQTAGVAEELRWRYFKIGNGKTNLVPYREKAEWHELVSVELGNGENVGAVKRWAYPAFDDSLPSGTIARIQDKIAAGAWREYSTAANWAGKAVADAMCLDHETESDRARIKAMLKNLVAKGFLKIEARNDDEGHERKWIVVGKPAPQDFQE